MISLLDLPAEIRNQIFRDCLVSPTGTVRILSRREAYHLGYPRSFAQSGPFFYLLVDDGSPLKSKSQLCGSEALRPTVSLSLPRTCRKMYEETNELFWRSNVFYFYSPHNLRQNFKLMGRLASQRIASIRLRLIPGWGNSMEIFDKAIQLLIKQGKHSSLRKLELLIDTDTIEHMAGVLPPPYSFPNLQAPTVIAERVLLSLRQAQPLLNVQKILVVTDKTLHTVEAIHQNSIVKGIHGHLQDLRDAWGGQLCWNSKMVSSAEKGSYEAPIKALIERLVDSENGGSDLI
ncbi:hypothetical protein NA56DRAFT_382958 [Hyaloscypha hepaticicola]|uniref:DUF7730 domain-containing protein n=1 Tax=Hyaloscypha hepaticicola TaxID=2082293 RepID=A0A2J6QHE0_9HELO|nr:hypothetical protein NA56DRAFT_382958 [Hyaloscypha hepaticicola]